MLQPKRVKRRRVHRGRMKGRATRGNKITRGEFGLVALEPAWITASQIEAARVAIRNKLKREGKLWINIFPHKPVTEQPAETRMGAGKGAPEYWVAVVKPDRVLFEIKGIDEQKAKDALRRASAKLPIKCKFASREELEGGEANES
jgi:large subunit ribosomal protein L16